MYPLMFTSHPISPVVATLSLTRPSPSASVPFFHIISTTVYILYLAHISVNTVLLVLQLQVHIQLYRPKLSAKQALSTYLT